MLLHVVKKEVSQLEEEENSGKQSQHPKIDQSVTNSLKSKLKIIITMRKMMKTLREEKELILKIKGLCPDNKIPRGLILDGPDALKDAYEKYKKAKNMDKINEKYPEINIDNTNKLNTKMNNLSVNEKSTSGKSSNNSSSKDTTKATKSKEKDKKK